MTIKSIMPHLEILKKYAIKHAVSFSDIKTNAIVEAMEEYSEQRVREELVKYAQWIYPGYDYPEAIIEDYYNHRNDNSR